MRLPQGAGLKNVLPNPSYYTYIKALKQLTPREFHKMVQHTLSDLVENFALLDDWEQRYQYLIELGNLVPPMEDALKTDATEVKGCVSKVWLHTQKNDVGQYNFVADSDGKITKGLVYIVLSAYDGKTADEIGAVQIEEEFTKLGLSENLSPNRRNGFFAMVEKIRSLSV